MLIVALLIAASQQLSPLASKNWNARTESRSLGWCKKRGGRPCPEGQYCGTFWRCVSQRSEGEHCTDHNQCYSGVCWDYAEKCGR